MEVRERRVSYASNDLCMKTLLILSPIALIAVYVAACLYIEKRRLRALALADKCKHGTPRKAKCWECEEERQDREHLNEITFKRERMDK